MPPIDLLIWQILDLNNGIYKNTARDNLLIEWQGNWKKGTYGRWTHQLIPNIQMWIDRSGGEIDYCLTQPPSGHGCFRKSLFQRRRSQTSAERRMTLNELLQLLDTVIMERENHSTCLHESEISVHMRLEDDKNRIHYNTATIHSRSYSAHLSSGSDVKSSVYQRVHAGIGAREKKQSLLDTLVHLQGRLTVVPIPEMKVKDTPINYLNDNGFYPIAYANDIAILQTECQKQEVKVKSR
nr:unnamed protein product [Callosobruchus analis]